MLLHVSNLWNQLCSPWRHTSHSNQAPPDESEHSRSVGIGMLADAACLNAATGMHVVFAVAQTQPSHAVSARWALEQTRQGYRQRTCLGALRQGRAPHHSLQVSVALGRDPLTVAIAADLMDLPSSDTSG